MTGLAGFRDKDTIKRTLPLEYVCWRLGIALDANAYACCPFHSDESPSFHLWQGDDGQERWSCQPCGVTGDVFDLLQRHRGIGFTAAVQMANEMLDDLPEGWQPQIVVAAPKSGPDDWGHRVQAAQSRAYDPRFFGRMAAWHHLGPEHDLELCAAMDEFFRTYLGWGIEETGALVMPHWTPQGALTGAKLRGVDGFRWSLEGSKYEHIYGAWLGRSCRQLLLTEGETDMAWAMWQAAIEGVEVDVRALPRGAGADVSGTLLGEIQGYGTVYLAFDPDTAGVEATRKWLDALLAAGFTDVRLCRLPLGKDLRDARPSLRRFLDSAQSPLTPPANIIVQPGGYAIQGQQGNVRVVSSWVIDPVAQLAGGDDGPGLEVDILSRGLSIRDVIRWNHLTSLQQFKKWAADRGLIFSGNDKDLQAVAEWIQWRATFVPEIFQTDRVGRLDPPEDYQWSRTSIVTPNGYIGDLPWKYAPGPKKADVSDAVFSLADEGPFDWSWLRAFLAMSDDSVMQPYLAWLVASARRTEVRNFPLLFIGGPSGVGKSTLALTGLKLVGSEIQAPLGSVTPYILMQRLACSTSFPVFVDEWTRLSRKDSREALQGLVPVVYEGGLAERGQSDLNVVRYRVTSPVLIAGEDTLVLDRELERVIRIFPKHSWQNREALAHIARAPIHRFARLLYSHVARADDLPPLVDGVHPTRPAHNAAVLHGGWATLRHMLDYARMHDRDVPVLPEQLTMPDEAEYSDDENVYEMAVRECASLRDGAGLPVAWTDTKGRGTFVRFAQLIGLAERNLDIEMPGRSRAMMDYFRGKWGLTEMRTRPPFPATGDPIRAYLIHDFRLAREGVEDDEPTTAADQARVE